MRLMRYLRFDLKQQDLPVVALDHRVRLAHAFSRIIMRIEVGVTLPGKLINRVGLAHLTSFGHSVAQKRVSTFQNFHEACYDAFRKLEDTPYDTFRYLTITDHTDLPNRSRLRPKHPAPCRHNMHLAVLRALHALIAQLNVFPHRRIPITTLASCHKIWQFLF